MITRYEGAHVFTGNGAFCDSFVVDGNRFVFAGSVQDARSAYPQANACDLGGGFVCPGFNDSHMHMLELGLLLGQAQLARCSDSLAHVLREVGAYAASNPEARFIVGRGFNEDEFADGHRLPTRDDLDAVCPDRPCLIIRACGHVAVANSAALRLAQLNEAPFPVDGGRVETDEQGRPNGVLCENAIALVSSLMPRLDRAAIRRSLLLAMDCVRRYGITSVQTDDFSSADVPFEEIIGAYLDLKAEGLMTVRVTEQCFLPTQEALERFLAAGYHTGWGDAWFRIGPLKLITDGSLGARTAFLCAPYADAPETCGIATYTQEALNALVLRAHRAGMQIAIHAIGDGAGDRALTALELAQARYPRNNMRHGLVHAQVLPAGQVARMGALHMHAYVQSIFLDYDSRIVESRLGSRAMDAYPAASLLAKGVTFSNGSDAPVEMPDVMAGIQCAVTRASFTHQAKPYLTHEALTLAQALCSFTAFGAYASFEEQVKGRIEAGYLADFTVLGADPFEREPTCLHNVPVRAVCLDGKRETDA